MHGIERIDFSEYSGFTFLKTPHIDQIDQDYRIVYKQVQYLKDNIEVTLITKHSKSIIPDNWVLFDCGSTVEVF